ncbi:alpha/beta fold hydrolase (plasmid) [Serratia marcescens]|nr:alpha/beta fold hydrolase [Serratia marcescens]QLJ63753.1 alpha/beta fold hydrolase [Serratia marcescens]BEM46483.1 hydrolase [Serratia marcescens]HEJ7174853.1 alpha/beta fold hydrolase [Serratia marcescens]
MLKTLSLLLLTSSFIPSAAQAGSIQWESCLNSKFHTWFDLSPPQNLRCGFLDVPLKYRDGSSIEAYGNNQTVRLALTLLPATGARKGSLVMLSGGPGMPGINPGLHHDFAVSKLRESWDIVGYDPRGVGQSTPKINCRMAENGYATPVDEWQEARNMLEACTDNTGAEVLRHIGTDEAVSDVDRIRQALNEPKLSAVAYSYGTQVAALYAERFPSLIRAIVLDGVVDLDEAKNDYIVRLNQERGYQQTFERFAAWCAETGSCPLSSDKALASQQYRNLLSQLHSHPISYGSEGQKVSDEELLSLTTDLLLWRSTWPDLATAVRQFSAGIVSKEISDKLDDYKKAYGDSDALSVISCVDQSLPALSQEEKLIQKMRIRDAFAATNFQPDVTIPIGLCEVMPWRNNVLAQRPANVPRLAQLLFVAQRYDATTPWNNARAMATLFNSPLVTLEGDGHTLALSGTNLCVNKAVVNYLMNPEKKLSDSTCR